MKKRPDIIIEIVLLILIAITGFYAFKNNMSLKNVKIPEINRPHE